MIFLSWSAHATELQNGDLIFMSWPCYECSLIEKTTGSPFSHSAILYQNAAGVWMAIMAVEPMVQEVTVDFLKAKALKPLVFMRMKTIGHQKLAMQAAVVAHSFIGTAFDGKMEWGAEKLYCAELIYFSFLEANNGEPVFIARPMSFEPYFSQWKDVLGYNPPEGQTGVNPGDLAKSSLLKIITP
jgi:hypothetical protein